MHFKVQRIKVFQLRRTFKLDLSVFYLRPVFSLLLYVFLFLYQLYAFYNNSVNSWPILFKFLQYDADTHSPRSWRCSCTFEQNPIHLLHRKKCTMRKTYAFQNAC